MTDEIYNDLAIEQIAARSFKRTFEIRQVVVREVPVSRTAKATVFLTDQKQLYLFVQAESAIVLDDVRKIAHRMGLQPEEFLPPNGDKDYFSVIARERFKATFPGKPIVSDEDLRFYKLLAPYNPALVRIAAVKTGEILQYDPTSTGWRKAASFSYRKVDPRS
jgi:hypothetical protein